MTSQDCGAVYICWGDPAAAHAEMSIQSLWRVSPGMPVLVVGDKASTARFVSRKSISVSVLDVDPFAAQWLFGFHAGLVKPQLARLSPFAKTLYVDADTTFKIAPDLGFKLLDRWDAIVVEADERSLLTVFPENREEVGETIKELGTSQILYHNSGVIFWRSNPVTLRLFEIWSVEWLRFRQWDEQVALLRALARSDALFLNVPYTWNCRDQSATFMVYHRFGSRAARKFRGQQGANPNARGVPPAVALVNLEVAPGRWVRVHAGNEESAREHFALTHPTKR